MESAARVRRNRGSLALVLALLIPDPTEAWLAGRGGGASSAATTCRTAGVKLVPMGGLQRRPPLAAAAALTGSEAGGDVYDAPVLYDLAFSYRDFEGEAAFLNAVHAKHGRTTDGGGPPRTVLEVGAGPARHVLAAVKGAGGGGGGQHDGSVCVGWALDSSAAMVAYGRELAEAQGTPLRYQKGDMASFKLEDAPEGGVESVWCLCGSAGHLLTGDAFEAMLRCCGAALAPGGTLVLELPHPRETFRIDDVTTEGWDVPEGDDSPLGIGLKGDGGGILGVVWGTDEDVFDPVTQVRYASVDFEMERQGEIVQRVSQVVPTREYTPQEIVALARLAGCFGGGGGTVSFYGAMSLLEDEDGEGRMVEVGDEDEAYRLVAVLTKEGGVR